MGQALYRKYRSKKLSEIVGQEHITTTLENALKKGAVSHAYLFTGPRGVGKTSIARILAHEVNGLPYDDSMHLDIIEIDAASNRRIDEIRDLREHVHSAPTVGKYKVYIIDEVHMLTKEAFNALLKTLEEPPEHVIFILATTESHKLPETIISRTQRFNFRPVELPQAVAHLASIASSENIDIDEGALKLIAEHGQGSFRDSISLLDQVSSGRKKVSLTDVQSTLGIAPQTAIESLLTALELGSASVILQTLEDIRAAGYHTPQIAKQLSKSLRTKLIENNSSLGRSKVTTLIRRLIDVPASHDPDTLLELTLIEALDTDQKPIKEPVAKPQTTEEVPKKESERKAKPSRAENTKPVEPEPEPEAKTETVELTKKETLLDESTWQEALSILKKKHNTLYGIARMASPTFSDKTVTLTFSFPFHQKRLDDTKNKAVLAQILTELLGTDITIICLVDSNTKKPKSVKKPDTLENISNIFGDAEVIE